MQPTLVIAAPAGGMVCINGRFAGESRPDSPLLLPVAPFGPVWLEFRPLDAGLLPLARKIVMSGGTPMAESLPEDLFVTLWPGNIAEIELAPEPIPDCTISETVHDGIRCRICRGKTACLEVGGAIAELPRDAEILTAHRTGGAVVLTGTAGGGPFLLSLSADLSRQTGFLTADRIEFEPPDAVRTVTFSHDFAGHGLQERYRIDGAGLRRTASESLWEQGLPRRPATAEEAAQAAVEAALLRRFDEAESYLLPGAQPAIPPESLPELGALCLPMKYGAPASAPALALLRPETDNLFRAAPLYYRAEPFGGEWRVTDLRL